MGKHVQQFFLDVAIIQFVCVVLYFCAHFLQIGLMTKRAKSMFKAPPLGSEPHRSGQKLTPPQICCAIAGVLVLLMPAFSDATDPCAGVKGVSSKSSSFSGDAQPVTWLWVTMKLPDRSSPCLHLPGLCFGVTPTATFPFFILNQAWPRSSDRR